eukprot:TRINITY_DN4403_c0_g1_i1.p1 TRINITY_DN4403_c0_g1~~TRINITY_DN4403_c0_g1_i1.p1  ORF type:complete len:363 (-),score=19.64 TRINITY_DN4403_c0_g1_i1:71-1159(-)
MANPRVFFDVSIGGEPEGRVVMELFRDAAPRTVENFRALCTGEKGVGASTGLPLHFKGCPFHRVIKGFMMQGGDFSNKNGTGGESIYGDKFEDEEGGLALKHDSRGLLSMANSGPGTNGSQFFVTFGPAPHLDGKHVVFGRVLKGGQVLRAVEVGPTDGSDRPVQETVITECGEIPEGADDGTMNHPDGDKYPDWPTDLEERPTAWQWWLEATKSIKDLGTHHFKNGDYRMAFRRYRKAMVYLDKTWDMKDIPGDTLEELHVIRDALLSNYAACKLKRGDYDGAIEDCTSIVSRNDKNAKAFFRRAQAYLGRNELEPAIEDLSHALKLEPNDSGIKRELAAAKKKLATRREKEKAAYAKMFG